MKKYLKIMLISIMLLTVMTGCNSGDTKNVITGDEFKTVMEELEYTVYDYTDSYDYANSAYIAVEDEFKIMFVDAVRQSDIQGVFLDECRNIAKMAGDDGDDNISNGDNYSTFSITTDDMFYYITLVGNTYLYVQSDIDLQSNMQTLIDQLGY